MNLNDMYTFSIVAKTGTVTQAAKHMEIPKSTVSRRIKRLEQNLGTELFHRGPKQIVLTRDGRAFFERISHLLDDLKSAEKMVQENHDEPSGILRITTTEGYAQNPRVMNCLSTYLSKFPKVKMELILTSRITKLVDEGIDIGMRLHTDSLPGDVSTMSRSLHSITSGIYASPSYLAKNNPLKSFHDLTKHDFVEFTGVSFPQKTWQRNGKKFAESLAFGKPRMSSNSTAALLHCALSGIGLCILDVASVSTHVARGELIRVLPQLEQEVAKASLVWVASKHLTTKVRSFIDHAVEQLAK